MTVSAKIQVLSTPVPVTLQTLAVFGIAAAYGRNLAVATILFYLAQGLVGMPVFAGAAAGPAYLFGPTAGYLAGFVVAAAIVGEAADRGMSRNAFVMFTVMLFADAIVFLMGFAWLATIIGPSKALAAGVVPFIAPDLVKIALASGILAAIWHWVAKR
ncbi:MAG: biotin transporter BioY [Pseudomonadota bacterium]